jgi:hypothetical protein
MTKLTIKNNTIAIKDGRKVVARIDATGLTTSKVEGIIAAADLELNHEALQTALEAAVAEARARKGSVIPDTYRHQYGVDQSCGDDIAKALTAEVTVVTGKNTHVDVEKVREVAATNGVEDRFDAWLAKDLNPGMLRMNLGNVLRGMARRGDEVRIADRLFCDFAD